mgnify:CR=1 FL=1|jgi:hypothetical protein
MDYTKLFKYYDGLDQLPEGHFKISPSSVANFFSEKTTWYRENLLGEPKKFTGSTSTVLGTCVHAAAEVVANIKISGEPYDSDGLHNAVEDYIASYDDNEEYDTSKIRGLWKNMAEALIKDYVLAANTIATENYISHEIIPGVWVGGTYDAITSSFPNDDINNPQGVLTVRDYKTASIKPSSFSYGYKLQAYTYAYILHQKGIKVSNVELCYTVQPTKSNPGEYRTLNFTAPFDDQAYNFIEGILKLIAESVQCFKDWPDMQYLLACDYRLKKNDIPRNI